MRARLLAVPLAVLISLTSVLVHAADPSDDPPPVVDSEASLPTVSPEAALLADANAYAQAVGISLDEALMRLASLPELTGLLQTVETLSPSRFAGGWIDHSLKFRAVIRFTGTASGLAPALAAVAEVGGPVEVQFGATHTMAELIAAQERITHTIHRDHPDMGSYVDARTGSVRLLGPDPLTDEDLTELTKLALVPVTSMLAPRAEPGHTYGGKQISNPVGSCTTGFTVLNNATSTRGVLTAGHCFDGAASQDGTYWETSISSYPAPFMGQRWDRNQDFQWHTTPSHVVYPRFWSGTELRDVRGTKPRATMTGETVCHYGINTGYSCGYVESIHYSPGGNYCNSGPCDAIWGMVLPLGPTFKCWFGDSGGPMFNGNIAFGTYSGQSASGPGSGQCNHIVMMTISALQWDGVNFSVLLA